MGVKKAVHARACVCIKGEAKEVGEKTLAPQKGRDAKND